MKLQAQAKAQRARPVFFVKAPADGAHDGEELELESKN